MLIDRHRYLPLAVATINLVLFITAISCFLFRDAALGHYARPSLIRILLSVAIPGALAYRGLKRKSIDATGAVVGFMICMPMVLSSYVLIVTVIACYLATLRATRAGAETKLKFEPDYQKSSQRNWIQVISNLGPASTAILLRLVLYGADDRRLDFLHPEAYWSSWLLLASLMSVAAALGDTFSSELGPVWAGPDVEPLLITNLRWVPRGTNGGVTMAGIVAACLGGLLIGLVSYVAILLLGTTPATGSWPPTPQWPLIHFCLYSGLVGSVLDSVLGATLQYSGFNRRTGRIVERPPPEHDPMVEHISGSDLFDNHEVNLLTTLLICLIMPTMAVPFWPFGYGVNF